MKRLLSILFLFFAFSPLQGMDSTLKVKPSLLDGVPARLAGYLYGLPEFFSAKQQLALYGMVLPEGKGYAELDKDIYAEIINLLHQTESDLSEIFLASLNPEKAANTPGFIVTNGGIFIDQAWWRSLGAKEDSLDLKRFFTALMVEQYEQGQYRKELALKMVVDGILVSTVIGIVTYTVAPSVCSWVAETVPGTGWLETASTSIATTATETCDKFYSPALCMMAGKTAWSSLLAPGVGPYVHALLTEPVARYLAEQAHTRAFEKIVNKQAINEFYNQLHGSDTESSDSDENPSSESETIETN